MDHVVSPDGEFALSRQGEAQIGLVKLMISFICSVLGWIDCSSQTCTIFDLWTLIGFNV